MALHRLTGITVGVPLVAENAAYYEEFGLVRHADSTEQRVTFSTRDGGEQLALVHTPQRRLVTVGVGAENPDDLDRIQRTLEGLEIDYSRQGELLSVKDPNSQLVVEITVADPVVQEPAEWPATNGPGRIGRANARAEGIERVDRVRPRKLGHLVVGSANQEATQKFFTEALGFKVSDEVPGLAGFLRCSTDHHNILIQQAPANFLHHTAWEVEDVDEIGRGAQAMLEGNPERHIWGLGRHHVGSNFFWYLKDPAGNFSEYYSDLDCIVEDALWKPSVVEGARGLYSWGPPPPPSFLNPEDLAALMTGSHSLV